MEGGGAASVEQMRYTDGPVPLTAQNANFSRMPPVCDTKCGAACSV